MTVQMTGRELDDIVRELYALPPTDFVAARNELVRRAKAAGSPEIAETLQHLRRPTRSAWLVNVLAGDSAAMQRLSALGRQLRDAQTGLAGADLRNLAEQRRHLIADLMDRARAHADEAGVRLTPTVLSEVQATLQAALVDLAGALTIRNGRLVRPLSHSGFGPRPRINVSQSESGRPGPAQLRSTAVPELERPPVEDELAARRRATGDRQPVQLVAVADLAVADDDNASTVAPVQEPEAIRGLRQAEDDLAAAEAEHWTSEFDLADAEAAVEAAEDAISELDSRRIEARRDKVTAQRHLAEARLRQRAAVNALAEARRQVEEARQLAGGDT